MRVFISGIAGFLGAHIAREGLVTGWQVTGADNMLGGSAENVPPGAEWLERDVRTVASTPRLLAGCDVVYHCAAAPYEGLSWFSPELVAEHTLMSTVSLLRASINSGVRRFVFCSSMARYGHQVTPFTEDMEPVPADPYASAKVASEQMVEMLCRMHGMEYVIAVPHNIYGPGQRYWDPYRNVAGIMINRVLQGKPPVIYGDGLQRRCLSYISDVTSPLLKLATEPVAGEVINVGPGDEGCTIGELAEMVLDVTGSALKPVYFPARPGEVYSAWCSDTKARKLLGYEPQVGLKEGLARYVQWVEETGPRPFDYHLPIEIPSDRAPATWTDQLM